MQTSGFMLFFLFLFQSLFHIIKPQKVLFLAVDGVAPRAKMNQQRGRRFRSAREAQDLVRKALQKGVILPSEPRFDSNCITPGQCITCQVYVYLLFPSTKRFQIAVFVLFSDIDRMYMYALWQLSMFSKLCVKLGKECLILPDTAVISYRVQLGLYTVSYLGNTSYTLIRLGKLAFPILYTILGNTYSYTLTYSL